MQETRVHFRSGPCDLEGLYYPGNDAEAVVVTHPHPLYGGDMFNPVVEAIVSAYQQCGFATLRFNFRGAGQSSGTHDNGAGEQDDVAAAMDFLGDQGSQTIHLSGYSFGAWVNCLALDRKVSAKTLTMVAPPVAFIEFDETIHLPTLSTVIAGSEDEFAPPSLIRRQMPRWNHRAALAVIQGADHFFFGFLDQVTGHLLESIRAQ